MFDVNVWEDKEWSKSYIGLNLFYSGIKYTEQGCVRLKVRHYPLSLNLTLLPSEV